MPFAKVEGNNYIIYKDANMTIELKPVDNRKSFYGKCKVIYSPAGIQLQSYNTIVATWDGTQSIFIRQWDGYSATTMRHINAFMRYLGFNLGGKAWWTSLPVGVPLTMHDILNVG